MGTTKSKDQEVDPEIKRKFLYCTLLKVNGNHPRQIYGVVSNTSHTFNKHIPGNATTI